jgi:hypothetical protein
MSLSYLADENAGLAMSAAKPVAARRRARRSFIF